MFVKVLWSFFASLAITRITSLAYCKVIIVKATDRGITACTRDYNCTGRNYSFDSLLKDLISNTILNITTDVILSSNIYLSNLQNLSIFGQMNPAIRCINDGRFHIFSCHNCVIEGIAWDGCGAEPKYNLYYNAAVLFQHSSNITIRNCTFQHSVGQAVALSFVSGIVDIINCKFVNNTNRGYCSGLHLSSLDPSMHAA